jgi:hypothetical protein
MAEHWRLHPEEVVRGRNLGRRRSRNRGRRVENRRKKA